MKIFSVKGWNTETMIWTNSLSQYLVSTLSAGKSLWILEILHLLGLHTSSCNFEHKWDFWQSLPHGQSVFKVLTYVYTLIRMYSRMVVVFTYGMKRQPTCKQFLAIPMQFFLSREFKKLRLMQMNQFNEV